jgi:hypothetical protein
MGELAPAARLQTRWMGMDPGTWSRIVLSVSRPAKGATGGFEHTFHVSFVTALGGITRVIDGRDIA